MDFRKRRMMMGKEAFMGGPTGAVGEVVEQTSFAEYEDERFARRLAADVDGRFGETTASPPEEQ